MDKLVLKNPYFEEEITVKEDHVYFKHSLDSVNFGHEQFIIFHQIETRKASLIVTEEP